MNFLQPNGAIINLQELQVMFSMVYAIASSSYDSHDNAMCIVDDNVALPPRSSIVAPVTCSAFDDNEGIAEANTLLLLEWYIFIAQGLVHGQSKCSLVLLMNFCNEFQHVP